MKQLAIGLAVALLGTVALAQTPAPGGDKTSGSESRGSMSGARPERTERGPSTGTKSETNVRIGIEARGRESGAVRSRGEVRERSDVEVRRRRSVTSVTSEEPESRVYVRQGHSKKIVVRKKRHGAHYVVRGRRHVVEEPSVVVRRRSVRRYETSEPSVSIRSRTTVRRSQEESVRGGASIERRESGARSESRETGASVTTNRETRGSGVRDGGVNKSPGASSTTSTNGASSGTAQPPR